MANQIREFCYSYHYDCVHPSTDFPLFYCQKLSVVSAWMTIFKVSVHRVSESSVPVFSYLFILLACDFQTY